MNDAQQATNALASLLASKVYGLIRDKLWTFSIDTLARYTQLHAQFAMSSCAIQTELDQFLRERDHLFRIYKDQIIQLSASADLLDKLSDGGEHHDDQDQMGSVVRELIEALTASVTESKTAMDHLIEVVHTD